MGYDSSMRGEITIEPPLRWFEYKDSPYRSREHAMENRKGLYLVERSEQVETDDGILEARTATAVAFPWPYPVRLSLVEEELQELVDAFPGHQFVGYLHGQGPVWGDIWRLGVTDGQAVKTVPMIAWPDGTILERPF
jgi:hypothetical protein